MKTQNKLIAATVLALFLGACSSNEQKQQADQAKIDQQLKQINAKLGQQQSLINAQQRDQYVMQVNERVKEYQKRISDLSSRANETRGTEASLSWNFAKNLQDQVTALKNDLNDLKAAPVDSWTTNKAAIDNDLAKAEDVYNQTSLVATSK